MVHGSDASISHTSERIAICTCDQCKALHERAHRKVQLANFHARSVAIGAANCACKFATSQVKQKPLFARFARCRSGPGNGGPDEDSAVAAASKNRQAVRRKTDRGDFVGVSGES